MKKISLLVIFLLSGGVNAENYILKIDESHYKNKIVLPITNINGFNLKTRLHQDTGTIYDPEGYDADGLGQETCLSYHPSYNNVRLVDYETPPEGSEDYYTFYYGSDNFVGHYPVTNFNGIEIEVEKAGFLYYKKGDITYYNRSGPHFYGYYLDSKWQICRKPIKS
jgi:hypothetical protein